MAVSLSSVTVKAWLRGHDFDLQDLADLLPSGNTCVVKDVDGYYLTSVEIDDRPEGVPFYEVAPRVLRRVNGLARTRNPNFEPVELNGHYTEEGGVHAVVAADTVKIRARVQAAGIVKGPDWEASAATAPRGTGARAGRRLYTRRGRGPEHHGSTGRTQLDAAVQGL